MSKLFISCRRLFLLTLLTLLWTATHARDLRAETIVLSDTIPSQTTNWIDALTIPSFDRRFGELTAITLSLETPIAGLVSYENTSSQTVTITSSHAVSIHMQLLDGTLLEALPTSVHVDRVPPYDGISDFQGTSGNTFTLDATLSVLDHYDTPERVAFFYSDDFLRFPITATGRSEIQGPGNFDAILRAQAAGVIFTVFYDYLPFAVEFNKFTNGKDADDPNGSDVPLLFPGSTVTWSYVVTNTGSMTLTFDEIRVADSDPDVNPTFDPTSDDGDRLLSPGETWRYLANKPAIDLQTPATGVTVVDGCQNHQDPALQRAYQNTATLTARNNVLTDPSHYCNPVSDRSAPGIVLKKLINGFDADAPNDADVPFYFAGTVITWTYVVTNTGDITFTQQQVVVTDDDAGLSVQFDPTSDGGDTLLSPGEQWRFHATGTARNLLLDTVGITVVDGCDPDNTDNTNVAYRNIGTVTVDALVDTDPAHYCNFPPTVIKRNRLDEATHDIYLPMIAR